MKKSTKVGIIYSILTPLSVWTGYELGIGNWFLAIPLILISMIFEFINVKLWIDAQTEDLKNN